MLKCGGGRGTGGVVRGWREARACGSAEAKDLGFKRKGMINSVTCC